MVQDAPKRAQDLPKTAQEAPKRPQDPPKSSSRGFQRPPRGSQEASLVDSLVGGLEVDVFLNVILGAVGSSS